MYNSSSKQIGRNMIIVVLVILLSYIFTMDSVKKINQQLLFLLLVFLALIIYKMLNYNAYMKYTNDKINEIKRTKNKENFSNNISLELEKLEKLLNNTIQKIKSKSDNNLSNIFNLKKIDVYN